MSDAVWISTAMGHASNQRPLTHSFSETEAMMDHARACKMRNEAGEPLGQECFPEEIFGAINAQDKDYKLPDIFFAGSYWAVSKKAAEIIGQYDLGGGALYPVRVLESDRHTPIGEGWCCINFGNKKTALIPEASVKMRQRYVRDGEKAWFPPAGLADDDLTVSGAALFGPNIWIDPDTGGSFFLSDALAKALKKASADKGFFLSKCRVSAN